MDEIKGKLISKIKGEGTLSEGPNYYIQPIDEYKNRWDEVIVRKKVHLWENDPLLHDFVGKKVKISGEIIETKSTITVDPISIEEIEGE